jgi:hypothetical protein
MNDTTKKQIEDFSLKIWGKNRTLEEKKLILQTNFANGVQTNYKSFKKFNERI